MNDKLLIIGAGGHGHVVADIAIKMNRWQEIAFLDDNEEIKSSFDIKVLGKSNEAYKYINNYDIFVAIGSNQIRDKIYSQLQSQNAYIPTLIHPSAIIGNKVEIGAGTVIMAGAVINCCSKIGTGCIINTGATIDHDNLLSDFVHISPGVHLAGTVKVGKHSWLGIGSTVSNNVNITDNCIIGAGAVVVKDILEAGQYIGVPARKVN